MNKDYLDNTQIDLERLHDDFYGWKPPVQQKIKIATPVILFIVTFVAVVFAGALQYGVNPFTHLGEAYRGLPFALILMGILLSHEMGHFLMSKHHDVVATLPYFIPAPNILGTFGAFIRMKSPIPDRNALVDIGAAGPLAGFLIALPALIIGVRMSPLRPVASTGGLSLGNSLLVSLVSLLVRPSIPAGHELVLGPIAFAGWIGMFVTAMNLIPIGQLDGGHIAYALFGRWYNAIARLALIVLVVMGIWGWGVWLFWALIILILGIRHPSPIDPYQPLDVKRKYIAWFAMIILIITFIPVPFSGI
ncbi:MAG: site-2 protease family protein [Deltaproteobacteria bacterium]|nr:site-2 protease family protein [Deltaproteobacteria bacterium]MCL5276368.1 site-2 protease family protein [Deltaproteobacteria bacterium]